MDGMMRRWMSAAFQTHRVTAVDPGQILIAEPPITRLRVAFHPAQSGSGTPSPTNVRPISGHDSIAVGIGADVFTASLGATYYGGTVDLVSGTMTVTHHYMDVNQTNLPYLTKYSVTSKFWCGQFKQETNGYPIHVGGSAMSNRFSQAIVDNAGRVNANTAGNSIYFFLPPNEMAGTTVSDAWAWFSDHPTQLIYQLATPMTVQLTPQTINALRGMQTVSCGAGSVEISYYTH